MKIYQLQDIQRRIDRALSSLQKSEGEGFSQSYTLKNGQTHYHRVNGIKSLDDFHDELISTFIWVWSMKDYLKNMAKDMGKNPSCIEQIANETKELTWVADIAKAAKHGTLNKSRSGLFAKLSDVGYTIPQSAIARVTYDAFDVTTKVDKPELVEWTASVVSGNGTLLGKAETVLLLALAAWETRAIRYITETQKSIACDPPPTTFQGEE